MLLFISLVDFIKKILMQISKLFLNCLEDTPYNWYIILKEITSLLLSPRKGSILWDTTALNVCDDAALDAASLELDFTFCQLSVYAYIVELAGHTTKYRVVGITLVVTV